MWVLQTRRPESGFWITPNWSWIGKMTMTSQFADMTSSSKFLTSFCFFFKVSFVRISYLSKFHVNIITGSGIRTISSYKGLIRNSKTQNIPVWVLPNIWWLGRVRDTKLGNSVSNEMLLNAAKCQGYSVLPFLSFKGKPTNGGITN